MGKMSKQELNEKARELRLEILDMTTRAGSGHPSSSWSSVEIVTALYFGGVLSYKPDEPWWEDRDRFIMSKGHAAPLLYAALAHAGYFDKKELLRLREVDSPVQGHPIQGMMPGVEATTGSLGQGLSLGIGHILGGRLADKKYRVYVLLGDGECEAGQIWEAAMAAAHFTAGDDRLALSWAERALHDRPNHYPALAHALVSAAHLGLQAEAEDFRDRILRLFPKMGLSYLENMIPYQLPEHNARMLDGFRKAGFSE